MHGIEQFEILSFKSYRAIVKRGIVRQRDSFTQNFWEVLYLTACGILVFQPAVKPARPAVEVGSLNH